MNVTEYKKYHESLMENNHGSTAVHTFLCIFFTVQCSLYCSIANREASYIFEYLAIVLPMIAAHTFLSEYIFLLNLVIFLQILRKFCLCYHKITLMKTFLSPNDYYTKHINLISILRGLTYLITVLCILAVDFQSFPRYLAKTERFGYSLMDTGVGLFVLMSGLVHKDLREHRFLTVLKSNTKFISVLLMLGIARYLSVKQLNYHEHVTEYGVHWNFFFTVAVCKLFSTILLYLSSHAFLFSICIIILHEYLLYSTLQEWVFSDISRTNLLNANREGIASSLGYVALYLFSVHVKGILVNKSVTRYKVIFKLILESVILWVLLYFINIYQPVSRTLANAGYFTFLAATMVTIISILYCFEVLYQNKERDLYFKIPLLLSAVNENGLVYFLIANLLTGAVNLSTRTMFLSSKLTFVILNVYMIVTIAIAVYFRQKGIKL